MTNLRVGTLNVSLDGGTGRIQGVIYLVVH